MEVPKEPTGNDEVAQGLPFKIGNGLTQDGYVLAEQYIPETIADIGLGHWYFVQPTSVVRDRVKNVFMVDTGDTVPDPAIIAPHELAALPVIMKTALMTNDTFNEVYIADMRAARRVLTQNRGLAEGVDSELYKEYAQKYGAQILKAVLQLDDEGESVFSGDFALIPDAVRLARAVNDVRAKLMLISRAMMQAPAPPQAPEEMKTETAHFYSDLRDLGEES